MADEKDLEIARLQGRLEQAAIAKASNGPSAGTVLLWILGVLVGGFVLLTVIGAMLPAPTAAELAAEVEARCRSLPSGPVYERCVARGLADAARRLG